MPDLLETKHPAVRHLVTGHFQESRGYATWRERGTEDWLLIYTLKGAGRFGWEGGQIETQDGDMILIRPGVRHDYGVEPMLKQWELLWTHFHPRTHWLEWLEWPEVVPGLMSLTLADTETRREIVACFFQTHRLAVAATSQQEAFAMNALERMLLWCDTVNPRSAQGRLDERVRRAMDTLCQDLTNKISPEELAQICGLSVSRLTHLFRQQVGLSPSQFLERQRLERARQLLELTPRTVQTIAAEVGFENPFYFTSRFKRHTGRSPRDYRQHKGEAG